MTEGVNVTFSVLAYKKRQILGRWYHRSSIFLKSTLGVSRLLDNRQILRPIAIGLSFSASTDLSLPFSQHMRCCHCSHYELLHCKTGWPCPAPAAHPYSSVGAVPRRRSIAVATCSPPHIVIVIESLPPLCRWCLAVVTSIATIAASRLPLQMLWSIVGRSCGTLTLYNTDDATPHVALQHRVPHL